MIEKSNTYPTSESRGYTESRGHSESASTGHAESIPHAEMTAYAQLIAQRAAIDAQLEEMDTTGVAEMRARWHREAEGIGKTPEDILGLTPKKRGRKSNKAKRDE